MSKVTDIEDLMILHKSWPKRLASSVKLKDNPAVVRKFRACMLDWYDKNKRDLPWRGNHAAIRKRPKKQATNNSNQVSPYQTWVSEIMCQQTRVETVIGYYTRWMEKFPTVQDLAKASGDEVNSLWAGLGYYSRARNLHKGAKYVVDTLDGNLPSDVDELLKIPGIGKYTAGAISSIAYGNPVPLVDGNVIRVLARVCRVSRDNKDKDLINSTWRLAGVLADPDRAGDMNQSLMELGATVCTPKSPSCSTCPIRSMCRAHVEDPGSESTYPAKAVKKTVPETKLAVNVIRRHFTTKKDTEYLMVRRPDTGLLAKQWEFVCCNVEHNSAEDDDVLNVNLKDEASLNVNLKRSAGNPKRSAGKKVTTANVDLKQFIAALALGIPKLELSVPTCCNACDIVWQSGTGHLKAEYIGNFVHVFSHLKHNMHVFVCDVQCNQDDKNDEELQIGSRVGNWMSRDDMSKVGLTKAMKKVLKLVDEYNDRGENFKPNKRVRKEKSPPVDKTQTLLSFKRVPKTSKA